MIGTLLNQRYQIDAELGRGGMGVVYRAHDTLLERDVAVKVISTTNLDTKGRTRLMHEARATAQLNHPNIVSVYDAGETELAIPRQARDDASSGQAAPFIVMELVEGESLHDRRPEALADILAITCQVCAALEHAHAHGIIHRDLKPENVMILSDGTAKLMDFGLALSVASRLTAEGTLVGTVFYLAPEQVKGKIDHRADLYALGVTLYELTTGGLPFTADDPGAVITQHLCAPVVPPRAKNDQIPPALDALIVRLLSKDPQDRPASAAEVLQTLEQPDFLEKDNASVEELSMLDRIVRGRLVGRERELVESRALWKKATAGEGQMLLISGEPGIGKTRLARELVTQAKVAGGRALVGVSYAEGGTPYGSFRQIIREALCGGSEDGSDGSIDLSKTLSEFVLADLLTLVPELRPCHPDVPVNPPLEPQAEQHRLYENVVSFFAALSERSPLALILEDVHWADSGTLALLHHLARRTRRQRLLFVVTYREAELNEARPFHKALLDLNRERLTTHLALARLNRAQTSELLAVLFAEEITSEFLDGIYRETEGNPFFVEEVCKALVESGELYYKDGRWHRPSMDELGIPQSIRVAIQSRVRALPSDIQESLAHHALEGGELQKGLDFSLHAAEKARRLFALEDALLHYRHAWEIAKSQGWTEPLLTIYEAMGDIQRWRDTSRSIDAFKRALTLTTNSEKRAAIKSKIGSVYEFAGDEQGLEFLKAAINELNPDTQGNELARAIASIGRIHHYHGQHREAITNYEQARQIAEPLDEPVTLAFIYTYLAGAHKHLGEFDKGMEWARHTIACGEQKKYPHAIMFGYECLAEASIAKGEWQDALEFARQERQTGEKAGLGLVAWAGWPSAQAHYGLGDLPAAEEAGQGAVDMAEVNGYSRLAVLAGAQLSIVQTDLGQAEIAKENARNAVERGRDLNYVHTLCISLDALAHWHMQHGNWEEAVKHLSQCARVVEKTDNRYVPLLNGPRYAEASLMVGEIEQAKEVVEKTLTLARETSSLHIEAVTLRVQAQILAAQGAWDEAARVFDQAIAQLDQLGSRLELGRALYHQSEMQAKRGEADGARASLTRALEIFQDCSAKIDAERTRAALDSLEVDV